jgi:Rrf2 family protein
MQFSAREYYGLRAMAEWARRYGDGPVSVAEVAESEGLPVPYLEQIIPSLREAGLLASTRGAHGGYALTREPGAISVADVIRALEGEVVNLRCAAEEDACGRVDQCAARSVWVQVSALVMQALQEMTLASLARGSG